MKRNDSLANLSERQLLHRFADLVCRDRWNTTQLLAAIVEIDERKLWAKHACSSMFAFCVERFHMSESMTAKRLWAARTARRFPVILQMVARGELHLSAITKIAKHLTEENHRALLLRARHKSSRELELLIAEMAPRPDVPSRIRALPRSTGSERADPCTSQRPGQAKVSRSGQGANTSSAPGLHERSMTDCSRGTSDTLDGSPSASDLSNAANPRGPRGQVVALAPRRYKIEITVDQQTHDKLRMLQDLLGHQLSNADPAIILRRAIDRLFDETLRKKAAVTDRPHTGGRLDDHRSNRVNDQRHDRGTDRRGDRRTRTIPAAIRREVWQRDHGRCTFVDRRGRRCRSTRRIEYHHERPYGKGGQHEVDNIALRCRAHNQYQADLDFGKDFMRNKRRGDGEHSARNAGAASAQR